MKIKRDERGYPLCVKCGKGIMSSSRMWCRKCEDEELGKATKVETRDNGQIKMKKTWFDKLNRTGYEALCKDCKCSPCEHMNIDGVFDPEKLWERMK